MTFDQQTHQFQLAKELERLIGKLQRQGSHAIQSEPRIISFAQTPEGETEPKTGKISMAITIQKVIE